MSNSVEYKIDTLNDLLKIPSDKIERMLLELTPYIKNLSEAREAISEYLHDGVDINDTIKLETLTWVDDGETNTTTNITFKTKEEGK